MAQRYATFEEFWPEYVRQHQNPTNRALHVLGTGVAVALVAGAFAKRKPWLLLAAPLAAYGASLAGHVLFEKNLPMSLRQPIYSVLANFVMLGKMARGKMAHEVTVCCTPSGNAAAQQPPRDGTATPPESTSRPAVSPAN